MLSMMGTASIYLYTGVTDMRKSFDGLCGLIEQAALADFDHLLSGAWFVFRNRRADMIKILYWDRDGLAIWYKRLERGRFQWPPPETTSSASPRAGDGPRAAVSIDAGELRLILEGIDLASVRRRRRWSRDEKASRSVENRPKLDNGAPGAKVLGVADDTASDRQSRTSAAGHPRTVRDGHGSPGPERLAQSSVVRS